MENFENQARGLSCLELEASVEANVDVLIGLSVAIVA